MKHKDTVSAILGSAFFAIPYLTLSVPVLPSLLIGSAAFAAGELVFSQNKQKEFKSINVNLDKILKNARSENKHILDMKNKIDNEEIQKHLVNINASTTKIINAIEKKPNKIKNIDNFFDYYLPITIKIVDRYDDIENQNLSSKESKKILKTTLEMLEAVDDAFQNILNSLYQSDIIDMDAEMKVFSTMLKSDGFNNNDLKIENGDDE